MQEMFGFVFELLEIFSVVRVAVLAEVGSMTMHDVWEFIKCRFPPIVWIPQYTLEKFRLDLTVSYSLSGLCADSVNFALIFVVSGGDSCRLHVDSSRNGLCWSCWTSRHAI